MARYGALRVSLLGSQGSAVLCVDGSVSVAPLVVMGTGMGYCSSLSSTRGLCVRPRMERFSKNSSWQAFVGAYTENAFRCRCISCV